VATHFSISYRVDDAEWRRARELRSDAEAEPLFDCFLGNIRIVGSERPIIDSYEMSVADLACGLAHILRSELPLVASDAEATFRQSDDSLELTFVSRTGKVRISSNLRGSVDAEVGATDFFEGARDFIRRFARDAATRVPGALDWKDLSILRSFADGR